MCAKHSPLPYAQSSSGSLAWLAPITLPCIKQLGLANALPTLTWQWLDLVYLFLIYQTAYILHTFWWKAPSNMMIAAYPTILGRYCTALHMVFDPETPLQRAYDSSNGKPFAIPMTDRWVIFVSDRTQVKELEGVSETVLSMEHALHELALTGPILGRLQVAPDHKGPKSEAFRVMIGVLKNKLRSNIPVMSEAFRAQISDAVRKEVADSKVDEEGWSELLLMPSLLRVFTRVNLLAFLGEEKASEMQVYDDVMAFFWSCAKAFPIVNLVPRLLMPFIGPVAMGWGFTRQKVYDLILRLTRKSLDGSAADAKHIAHWTAEMTKLRDAAAVARVTLGLLFASAFQVPMIAQFVIHRLCVHPEYREKLRAEATESADVSFGMKNEDMPYLDSFIKETSRLSPGLLLSAPRTVMEPYTSSDGCHIPPGNWIAIPQVALMLDETIWPRASSFEGFRFVDRSIDASETRWTHPSYEYPFWGSIRHACPARFYVSVVMKMILSHLLIEYEFKLKDEKARPYLTFGKVRLPSVFMVLLVKKRASGEVKFDE
ncbi:cytochrome P450 [Lophium mytilinum]|uniref:Cytochrome P450 n=1 Tax=Lophium mytilinum TaxID=390894 RepID=A0A6A6R1M9_9PEZI|nr:cytochrome P450 [Lophium mytilinum]